MEEIQLTGTKAQQWVVNAFLFGEIDPRKPDPVVIPDDTLSEMECEVYGDGTIKANENITDIALFLYIHAKLVQQNISHRITIDPEKTIIAINHFATLMGTEKLRRLGSVEYEANSQGWLEEDIKLKVKNLVFPEEISSTDTMH